MIAGFPTETEEMFDNAATLAEECGISSLHVFPYSPRAGTPAARMPQLDRALVKERAARLRERGETLRLAHLQNMVGSVQTILVENNGLLIPTISRWWRHRILPRALLRRLRLPATTANI